MKHWISPDIKYKTFKLLNDKLSPQDLAPKNYTKMMWEMIRDRKINCYIDDMAKEDAIFFTLKEAPVCEDMSCPCNPKIDFNNKLVIHNSFDLREWQEQGGKDVLKEISK